MAEAMFKLNPNMSVPDVEEMEDVEQETELVMDSEYVSGATTTLAVPPVDNAPIDILSLKYPRYSNEIRSKIAEGLTTEEIEEELSELEREARAYHTEEVVDAYLRRTPQTKQRLSDYNFSKAFHTYKETTGLKPEEVLERYALAKAFNLNEGQLMTNNELYKEIKKIPTNKNNETENIFVTMRNAFDREHLSNEISKIGIEGMLIGVTEDQRTRVSELQKQLEAVAPPEKPFFSQNAIGGAVEFIAQMARSQVTGAAGAAGGAALGTVMGPVGAGAGASAGYLGAVAFDIAKREAGSAFIEYLGMKDENGKPMDADAARAAAIIVGGINAGLEFAQLDKLIESFPGGKQFFKKMNREGVGKILQVPSVRNALAKGVLKYGKGVAEETLEEVAQELVTIMGGELGKAMSGQEFKGMSFSEAMDRLVETGKQMGSSGLVFMLPGSAVSTGLNMRQSRADRITLENVAAKLNTTPEELLNRPIGNPIDNLTKEGTPREGKAVDIEQAQTEQAQTEQAAPKQSEQAAPEQPTTLPKATETGQQVSQEARKGNAPSEASTAGQETVEAETPVEQIGVGLETDVNGDVVAEAAPLEGEEAAAEAGTEAGEATETAEAPGTEAPREGEPSADEDIQMSAREYNELLAEVMAVEDPELRRRLRAAIGKDPLEGMSDQTENAVFLPRAALETYEQKNPGLLEAMGVDMTKGTESEVMMAPAQYETLAANDIDFAKATENDVRQGTRNLTRREALDVLQKKIAKDRFSTKNEVKEMRAVAAELEKKAIEAGIPKAVARSKAKLVAVTARTLARSMPGKFKIADFTKIDMRKMAYEDWKKERQGQDTGIQQAAAMYRNPAKTIAEFKENVLSGKSGHSFFKITDKDGSEIEITSSAITHVDYDHHLTNKQWQAIVDGISENNFESVYFITGQIGESRGQIVSAKINTPLGKAGIVLEVPNSGRVFLKSAFLSTDNNLDNNWIKKPKVVKGEKRTPKALETDKTATAISSGRPLSIKSIQEALGIVNPDTRNEIYRQIGAEPLGDRMFAVHGVTTQGLMDYLSTGKLIAPSIGIVNMDTATTGYGQASIIFGRDTIDPQKDPRNKAYPSDAITPRYPDVQRDYSDPENERILRDKFGVAPDLKDWKERGIDHHKVNIAWWLQDKPEVVEVYKRDENISSGAIDTDALIDYLIDFVEKELRSVDTFIPNIDFEDFKKGVTPDPVSATPENILEDMRRTGEEWDAKLDKWRFTSIENIQEHRDYLRSNSMGYFEVKPYRFVELNEIKGVVLPNTASRNLKNALRERGIDVEEFKEDSVGDKNRVKATRKLAKRLDKNHDILFQNTSQDGQRMFAMHTVRANMLNAILRTGKFTGPSLSITNEQNPITSGYGNVMFIAPSFMVDPEGNADTHVFPVDVWTPRYPNGIEDPDEALRDMRSRPIRENWYSQDSAAWLRAEYAPEFKNMQDIKDARGNIVDGQTYQETQARDEEEMERLLNFLGEDVEDGIYTDEMYSFIGDAIVKSDTMDIYEAIEESAESRGWELNLETVEQARLVVENTKSPLAKYFEAKLMRGVDIGEFVGVVLPKETSENVKQILKDKGLRVFEYTQAIDNGRSRAEAVLNVAKQLDRDYDVFFQRVYHGSPHKNIARFDNSKIGTGEGNQAFGYGFYLTQNDLLALEYATNFTEAPFERLISNSYKKNGNGDWTDLDNKVVDKGTASALDYIEEQSPARTTGNELQTYLRRIRSILKRNDWTDEEMKDVVRVAKEIYQNMTGAGPIGSLIAADIPESDVLLDIYKSVSEQPPTVRSAIERFLSEYPDAGITRDSIGRDVYRAVSRALGGDKAASQYLSDLGVEGAQYPNEKFLDALYESLDIDELGFHELERIVVEKAAASDAPKSFVIYDGDKIKILTERYNQRVYHGSPHRGITKMSLEKINTGEGSQVYGWGIYFAELREIAERYKEMLSKINPDDLAGKKFDGKTLLEWSDYWTEKAGQGKNLKSFYNARKTIAKGILTSGGNLDYAAKSLAFLNYDAEDIAQATKWAKETFKAELDKMSAGQVYNAEIPDSDVLLDYDKPFNQQPEKVKAILKKADLIELSDYTPETFPIELNVPNGIIYKGYEGENVTFTLLSKDGFSSISWDEVVNLVGDTSLSGERIYQNLSRELGSDKAASEYLNSLGIPGLQYLDEGSRGAGEGTHNFVIWNEDVMNIVQRYYQATTERMPDTNSPEFQRWFGESKVVGEDGKPLVVYHATNNTFDTFQSGNSAGIYYFAFTPKSAKSAARGKKITMPVFLRMENPVNTRDNPIPWHEAENSSSVTEWRKHGYDGVYVKDEARVSIAVFSPEQIKSVKNRGTWDAGDPNIYRQEQERRETPPNAATDILGEFVSLMTFFEGTNASTPFHEMMHHVLNIRDQLSDTEGVADWLKQDHLAMLREFGVNQEQFRDGALLKNIRNLDETARGFLAENPDITVREYVHERFAKGFEVYLATGEAPSAMLRDIFENVRKWLLQIYEDIQKTLGIELSEEMKGIYDRMLATPEEITAERAARTKIGDLAVEDALIRERIAEHEAGARVAAEGEGAWAGFDDAWLFEDLDALAQESVDGYLAYLEEWDAKQAQKKATTDLLAHIQANLGKINVGSLANMVGKERADEIRQKKRGLFSKDGLGLDVIADGLNMDVNDLVQVLENWTPQTRSKMPLPLVEINTDTLNVFIDRLGVERTREYLTQRKRYLTTLQKGIQAEYDRDKTNEQVRQDLEKTYAEQKEIADSIKALDAMLKDPAARQARSEEPAARLRQPDSIPILEAMRRGYEMAEKYAKGAYREGLEAGRAQAKEHANLLKAKRAARDALKKEIKNRVKEINKMAQGKTVRYDTLKAMREKLSNYDLKRRRQSTLDRRAEMEEYLRGNPEAADDINPKDLQYVGTTTLNAMTVEDLRTLHEEISEMYERGQREYAAWEAEAKERSDKLYAEMREALEKRKADMPPVKASPKDVKKQYKGPLGGAAKIKDWTYAATLSPTRFFDWLDGGGTKYDGPFSRLFGDAFNKAYDDKLRHVFERRNWMQERIRDLGLDVRDFSKIRAKNVAGRNFTVDEIMEIYMGMRNKKKADAILGGVFGDERITDPQAVVLDLIGHLTDEEKRAADLVAEDHNRNADRVERAFIDAFNHGFEREENYTSIHRIEHGSPQGLIDAEDAEFLGQAPQGAGALARIRDEFTKSRVDIPLEHQTGITLGLFANWHKDVDRHEHAAAFAQTAKETAGALLARNKADNATIGRMIKERFGDEAWKTLADYFNISVTDEVRKAQSILNNAAEYLAQHMSVAYLCGNLSTALQQTTSIPRFLITAGPHRIFTATAQFAANPARFLEEVYELDPQMRDRTGNALLKAIRSDPNWGKNAYQRMLQLGFEPITMMDRWVAAIGWKATYDANLKRLGQEGAARAAQRAVALTQQATTAKDTSRLWRESGMAKLSMVFTSDAAQTFGMTVYDLTQQIKTGRLDKALGTVLALAVTAVCVKALKDGIPSGEPDDDEEDANGWMQWTRDAFTEQSIRAIPLVGNEAMTLYKNLEGQYKGTQYSAFVAPVERALRAAKIWTSDDEEKDEEEQARAAWFALEALSLGPVKFPYMGVKRAVQSTNLWLNDDEPLAAALNMVGNRPRRIEE
jgi:hypothetical protein